MHSVDTSELPIGRALKVERVAAGVSLGAIATAIGVSMGHLSHIEAGRRTASPEQITRIRAAIRTAATAAYPASLTRQGRGRGSQGDRTR